MKIHQLSINYHPEQDRVLVQISTQAQEMLRVWFTRRMLLQFLPQLTQQVSQAEVSKAQLGSADDSTKQMLMAFKKQASLAQGDFKTPFQAQAKSFPLGPEPLLATTLQMVPMADGNLQIGFHEKLGATPRNFQINLDTALLHNMIHLLEAALQTSGWSLAPAPTNAPTPDQAADLLAPGPPRKYLN
ncbi:MAG: hypothetical protein PHH58_08115 [Rhodoferax sp.]|nr:hypothetical protein [Rhodoferax sp.]